MTDQRRAPLLPLALLATACSQPPTTDPAPTPLEATVCNQPAPFQLWSGTPDDTAYIVGQVGDRLILEVETLPGGTNVATRSYHSVGTCGEDPRVLEVDERPVLMDQGLIACSSDGAVFLDPASTDPPQLIAPACGFVVPGYGVLAPAEATSELALHQIDGTVRPLIATDEEPVLIDLEPGHVVAAGGRIAFASEYRDEVLVYDLDTVSEIGRFEGGPWVMLPPNGSYVAFSEDPLYPGLNRPISVVDLATGTRTELEKSSLAPNTINDLGAFVALPTSAFEADLGLLDPPTGEIRTLTRTDATVDIRIPGGRLALQLDGDLAIWDIASDTTVSLGPWGEILTANDTGIWVIDDVTEDVTYYSYDGTSSGSLGVFPNVDISMMPGGAAVWTEGFLYARSPERETVIVDESVDVSGVAFGGRSPAGVTEVVEDPPPGSLLRAPFLEPGDLVYNTIDEARYGLFRSRVP